jgi:hypothetical protein
MEPELAAVVQREAAAKNVGVDKFIQQALLGPSHAPNSLRRPAGAYIRVR